MDSFWTISGFLGHQNDFWKFQKVFNPKNCKKENTGHFTCQQPTEAFLKGFVYFLSIPSCGTLRKTTKPFKKCLIWPRLAGKNKILEIGTFNIIR